MSLAKALELARKKKKVASVKTTAASIQKAVDFAKQRVSKPKEEGVAPTVKEEQIQGRETEQVRPESKIRRLMMSPVPEKVVDLGGGIKEFHLPTGEVFRQDEKGMPVETPRTVSQSTKDRLRGGSFQETQMEIDHLVPKALGGTDDDTNLKARKSKKTLSQAAYDFITGNERLPGSYSPQNRQEGKMVVEWEAIRQFNEGKITSHDARAAVAFFDDPDFVGGILGEDFAMQMPTEKNKRIDISELKNIAGIDDRKNYLKSGFFKLADMIGNTSVMKGLADKANSENSVFGKSIDNINAFFSGISPDDESDIPFVGIAYDISDATRAWKISNASSKGETISEEDRQWYTEMLKREDELRAKRESSTGIAYRVGEGIKESLVLGIEIAGSAMLAPFTGGTSTLPVLGKIAIKKGATKTFRKVLTNLAKKPYFAKAVLRDIGAWTANTGVKVGVPATLRTPSGAIERATGTPIRNENGDYSYSLDDGQEIEEAVLNSFADNIVEVGSEYSGAGFTILGKGVKEQMLKTAILNSFVKKNPTLKPNAVKQFFNAIKFDGFISELGEERLGDGARIALSEAGVTTDYEYELPTRDDVVVELVQFGLMGVAANSLERLDGKTETQIKKEEKEREDVIGRQSDEVKADIIERLDSGKSPVEVVGEISVETGTETAQALVTEAIEEVVSDNKDLAAKKEEKPKEEEQVDISKMTVGDIHADFLKGQAETEKSVSELKREIRSVSEKAEAETEPEAISAFRKSIEEIEGRIKETEKAEEERFLESSSKIRRQIVSAIRNSLPNAKDETIRKYTEQALDRISDEKALGKRMTATVQNIVNGLVEKAKTEESRRIKEAEQKPEQEPEPEKDVVAKKRAGKKVSLMENTELFSKSAVEFSSIAEKSETFSDFVKNAESFSGKIGGTSFKVGDNKKVAFDVGGKKGERKIDLEAIWNTYQREIGKMGGLKTEEIEKGVRVVFHRVKNGVIDGLETKVYTINSFFKDGGKTHIELVDEKGASLWTTKEGIEIAPAQEVAKKKAVKKAAKKKVKTEKKPEAKEDKEKEKEKKDDSGKPKGTSGTKSNDKKTQDILSSKKLSVSEKVDAILDVKQEGKRFKDKGNRVAGSKKEKAAISAVMDSGDREVMDEMIDRIGIESVSSVVNKQEILSGYPVPSVEEDKKNGVPSLVSQVKRDLFVKIPKSFTPIKKSRAKWKSDTSLIKYQPKDSEYAKAVYEKEDIINGTHRVREAFNEYQTLLREYAGKIEEIRTVDDIGRFWEWAQDKFRNGNHRFVSSVGENMALNSEILGLDMWKFGIEPLPGYVFRGKKMPINAFIRLYNESEGDKRQKFDDFINDSARWEKMTGKKSSTGGSDLSHGNFEPMDLVKRTEPNIPQRAIKVDTLTEKLGFKSVQLGNYMDDVTANKNVGHTIGAVLDMSKVTGIDFPAVINKLGLSISYGARGGGNFAAAHYEPAHNIINLTKGKGDGSFFHEFTHFLDFQLPKLYRLSGTRVSSSRRNRRSYYRGLDEAAMKLMGTIDGSRYFKKKEVTPVDDPAYISPTAQQLFDGGVSFEDAVKEVEKLPEISRRSFAQSIADLYGKSFSAEMMVFNEPTDYINAAKSIGGAYWYRNEELLARAAQAYIEDKMAEKGMENHYLTRKTVDDRRYPQGEDRIRINKAFDALFDWISNEFPYKEDGIKFKVSKERPAQTMTEAAEVLSEYKERLGIDFDVMFVDSILTDSPPSAFSSDGFIQGLTADNTVVLLKEMSDTTAEHEVVHLTISNIERIEAFRREGITRDGLMKAKAKELGVVLDGNETMVEEAIAEGFEEYIRGKEQSGIVRKFFVVLKQLLVRFIRAVRSTGGDMVSDYYDILSEGRSVENEIVRLENKGIMESFVEDGIMTIGDLERTDFIKLKVEKGDKRLKNLTESFNKATDKAAELQSNLETWNDDLQKTISKKESSSGELAETPEDIKKLARFRHRTGKRSGEVTANGKAFAEVEFENPEAALEELSDYLKRKTQLIETRNRLRSLRRRIAKANKEGKINSRDLRELERRMKLRERVLKRNDHYITVGMNRGKEEAFKMVRKRKAAIRLIRNNAGLKPKDMREMIKSKAYETMTEADFSNYLSQLASETVEIKKTKLLRKEAKAFEKAKKLQNTQSLIRAMGFPRLSEMDKSQVERFVNALAQAEYGDRFLSRRELETIHRTEWGEVRTVRELAAQIERHMGIPRATLKTIEAPKFEGLYKSWISLARSNPFYNWAVSKRFAAQVQAEREYHAIEQNVFTMTNRARKSREKLKTLTERLSDLFVPTDEIVFGYIEAEDKSKYAEKNEMTKEELELADYLIAQYHAAYEYLTAEGQLSTDRKNYITHVRRSFLEAVKDDGVKSALSEVFDSQKQDEAVFNLLDSNTGQVLAFEKFFSFALRRTGGLMPSQNVAKASLAYFRALTRKKALDSFVPDVMLAVKVHELMAGHTEKGLSEDPKFRSFMKRWLNDFKGRSVNVLGIAQGSKTEAAIKAGMSWVSLKYLGFNIATGMSSVVGDYVAVAAGLKPMELAKGILRGFDVKHSTEATRAFSYFIGRNPFGQLLDPSVNLPSKVQDLLMILFSISNYQGTKLFVRSKLTEQEWQELTATDERMAEIARELSKWKSNKFYIPTLAGNTAVGQSVNQFKGWAMPIMNTALSGINEVRKSLFSKGGIRQLPSNEGARELLKLGVYATVAVLMVNLMPEPEDDDYGFAAQTYRKVKRELTTLWQAMTIHIQYSPDKNSVDAPFMPLIVDEMTNMINVMLMMLSQEEYSTNGAGYMIGDKKWLNSAYRVFTPRAIRQFTDEEHYRDRNAKNELIEEAAQTGDFDPEAIGSFLNPEKWEEEGEKADAYRERVKSELTVMYNLQRKYPDSVVARAVMDNTQNADRIAAMLEYANEVGIDNVTAEIKELHGDRELMANPKKKTGLFISDNLYKAFKEAARKYENAPD